MKFRQWIRNFLRRMGAFILVVLLALVSLSFIAHIPVVQKFGVQHITQILSNITGTKVTVDAFSFNFFNSLEFDRLYVEAPQAAGDTLFYVSEVNVRFANLITLASGRLNIREIELNGVELDFTRADTASVSDVKRILNRLSVSDKGVEGAKGRKDARGGLKIRAGILRGTEMHVKYFDDHKNTQQEYTLDRARFDFRKIVPDSNILRLHSAHVEGLSLSIWQWAPPDIEEIKDDSLDKDPLRLEIGQFIVDRSNFRLINETKGDTAIAGGMNYQNLDIDSIHIYAEDFVMDDLNFEGKLREMSCKDHSGFELSDLSVDYVSVADTGLVLEGFDLYTEKTHLKDTLRMDYSEYAAFKDFVNEVYLYGHFTQATLAIDDLLKFVPKLRQSAFFAYNEDKLLRFSGLVRGNINRLRASELNGRMGELVFEGDFRSRNLTVKNEQFLNLRLKKAVTSMPIMRRILPNFNLPDQYDNLGTITFSGRYDGFFNDFVAYGNVATDIGSATLDMRLDITEGVTLAEYSGGIGLDSFDIGKWSENPNFGQITTSAQIISGRGLTSESANAEIQGGISSLEFKGYTYRNAVLNGLLDENYFSGDLEIVDENIDLKFTGTVDMRDDDPKFDFLTTIDSLDLLALNLVQDTFNMSGSFIVKGTMTPSRGIDGIAKASDVHIERGLDEVYDLDTIGIISQPEGDVNHYRFTSDYINGRIDGSFALQSVAPQFKEFFTRHYPALFDSLAEYADTARTAPGELIYDIRLSKPEEWSGIFKIKDLEFDELAITGELDFRNDSLTTHIRSPKVVKGSMSAQMLSADMVVKGPEYGIRVGADTFLLSGIPADGISLSARGDDANMDWELGLASLFDTLSIALDGTFAYDSAGNYAINVDHRDALLFDPAWELEVGNRIAWGPGFVEVDSFYLKNDQRFIGIADIDSKGVVLDIENFDLAYLNEIWDYDKLDFAGNYSLDLRVEDVFKRDQINLLFDMEQLVINNDSFGVLSARVTTAGAGDPLVVQTSLGEASSPILRLDGSYDPVTPSGFNVDLRATLADFPGWFLEYFLKNSISNTDGTVTGVITLKGDSSAVVLDGSAWARDAATTVEVTGVRYSLNDFEVSLTNDYIDLSNAVITDPLGNTAAVTGGLRHDLMKDLELDIRVESPRILGIDLQKSNDVVFYGTGIGAADVIFSGYTRNPSLLVNATTSQGTRVYMPLDQAGNVDEESFIRFVQRDSLGNIVTASRVQERSGINLELNLNITPDAQVDLIFNEYTRDILRGVADGNLQIFMNPSGEMTLFGDVEVVSGNYLFTSRGVNKPFNIRRGGTIVWTGDPYEAQLNIRADYVGLRTSVAPLIEEYLINATPTAQQEARQLTKVQLELILTGPLSEPNINFDIRFPDITGELSGYLNNKMKALQNDPNALNQQAFSLIIFGTFLPSSDIAGINSASLAQVGAWNTISEFISSQLSYYISEFLQGAIEDIGFISGIDVDVGYNQSYDFYNNTATVEEWEVHMRNRLFDDRIIVDVGGSYVTDNPWTSGTYFAGDYALEYSLTEDGRLRVRLYYRNDRTIEGIQNRTGIGLSYRREFDNFIEWLRGNEKEGKKSDPEASRNGEQQLPN